VAALARAAARHLDFTRATLFRGPSLLSVLAHLAAKSVSVASSHIGSAIHFLILLAEVDAIFFAGLLIIIKDLLALRAGDVVGNCNIAIGGIHVEDSSINLGITGLGNIRMFVLFIFVALNERLDRDHAVLVTLDLLINVVRLELGQNLNNCLLQLSTSHQLDIVLSCELLLQNTDPPDGLHLVSYLVILLGHELPNAVGLGSLLTNWALEDQDSTLLLEVDLVQHLNTGESAF